MGFAVEDGRLSAGRSRRLGRSFFAESPEVLAAKLLGQRLVRVLEDGTRLAGLIVETEAYLGARDEGSHARGGRRTPRNEAMYARPGTAYVYFTYGMHFCMNVVCGAVDEPVAVLLRAVEPTEGLDFMRENRTRRTSSGRTGWTARDEELCSGPARLCQALAIERSLNGLDLTEDPRLFIERGPGKPGALGRSPRIGLSCGGRWGAARLRWFVKGNLHVSGRG